MGYTKSIKQKTILNFKISKDVGTNVFVFTARQIGIPISLWTLKMSDVLLINKLITDIICICLPKYSH
jgi:hypothetical protein